MMRFSLFLIGCLTILGVSEPATAQTSETVTRGAQLWNTTCSRCHNRRVPTERTDRQWDVIVSHMRTRANLTKSEVEAISAFLKTVNDRQKEDDETPESTPDSTAAGPAGTTSEVENERSTEHDGVK